MLQVMQVFKCFVDQSLNLLMCIWRSEADVLLQNTLEIGFMFAPSSLFAFLWDFGNEENYLFPSPNVLNRKAEILF